MQKIEGIKIFKMPTSLVDNRGNFKKIYSLNTTPFINIEEVYLTKTEKGFIRGIHFQREPYQNNRVISCIEGKVFDVLLDLRPNTNTFLNIFSIELNSLFSQAIYVPSGVAHGFQSLEDNSEMLYLSDKIYNSNFDSGVSPIGLGIPWPIKIQGMSKRDATLPTLSEYLSRI
jgi:dTDP-4-dehydrorhamnose 3,5-epimerase